MAETLKPCPFCGGDAEYLSGDNICWSVACAGMYGSCWIMPETADYETKEEAAEAWNRRTRLRDGVHETIGESQHPEPTDG